MVKNLNNYNLAHDSFIQGMVNNLGENLYSVISIGSWVTKTVQPGLSDLDLLLITRVFNSKDLLTIGTIKKSTEDKFKIGIGVDLITLTDLQRPRKLPGKALLSLIAIKDGYSKLVYGTLPEFDLGKYLFSSEFFFFNFKLMYYLENKSMTYLTASSITKLRKAVIKKLRSCMTLLRLINIYENGEREFNNEKLLKKYHWRFQKYGISDIYELSGQRKKLSVAKKDELIKTLLICQDFIDKLANVYLKGN